MHIHHDWRVKERGGVRMGNEMDGIGAAEKREKKMDWRSCISGERERALGRI